MKCHTKRKDEPTGYIDWHDWAELQFSKGIEQVFCEKCKRWYYVSENYETLRTELGDEMSKKWYGKIIYDNHGIETYEELQTEAEAIAFVKGFNAAKTLTAESDDDPLQDYYSIVDQLEPINE
jgi:hypothetical protein